MQLLPEIGPGAQAKPAAAGFGRGAAPQPNFIRLLSPVAVSISDFLCINLPERVKN